MRVVLDTNVILSALLFTSGRLSWIRGAWLSGQIVPVLCAETAGELLRVLTYPKFRLTNAEQEELLADFLPFAEVFLLPEKLPPLPTCRDGKDQVFLALACCAAVDALVTGDVDIQTLAAEFTPPILAPESLRSQLAAAESGR